MMAAENGMYEVAEKLISKGADVNAINNDKWTALIFAAAKGTKRSSVYIKQRGWTNAVNADVRKPKPARIHSFDNISELIHRTA